MAKIFPIVVVAVILWENKVLAAEYYAVTPSGATEMLFDEPAEATAGKLSAKCIDARWNVTSSTATEVVCEAPMNFGQSLMGTLLMGNSYSTPPRQFFKYSVATVNGISRVQASGWMELQMAFGQVRRTDFSGPDFHNGAINFMAAAGGHLPQGTTFPNHVFLGVILEPIAIGKTGSVRVTSVLDGSPAAQAGIQVGDVVISIAQKRLKQSSDLLDATAKAANTPNFVMELIRDNQPIKITIMRAYRPAFNEVLAPAAIVDLPAPMDKSQPASVADEIAKLAKLKVDGIITQAEFDQQKTKLLSR